jgi:hypothetical protein
MKKTIFLILISIFLVGKTTYAQIHDNGIGGYGYLEYNIMHNSRLQGNWMYGGGGLIINKVYFAGLYYGSQTTSFTNYDENNLYKLSSNYETSILSITPSDFGAQFGGVILAEKPIQFILSAKIGTFLSNVNDLELVNNSNRKTINTKPFLTASPELKVAFMPAKIFKMQAGVGYKFVHYGDSRILENSDFGNRNTLFNSFYWSFSVVFGSF